MKPWAVNASVLVAVSVVLGLLGYGAGALSLSGAEPDGVFVDCGPAVFGRASTLPDPACGSAYAPLVPLTYVMIGLALLALAGAVWIVLDQRRAATRTREASG